MAAVGLNIQLVLYATPLATLWRALHAVAAAAAIARDRGWVSKTAVLLGDCHPTPGVVPGDVEALDHAARQGGLDGVSYTFFDANLGSAGGSNRLAEQGRSPLLLVLNPDTYVAPTLLAQMVAVFDDPSVALADARQLPLEHPKHYDPSLGDTSWASGSCMMVRRSAFERLGGFDTDHFFLYCDDVDFSWRARLAGYRVVHVPSALVFHDKRITVDATVEPAETEDYFGLLGRLMLARRYDREDVMRQTIAAVEAGGNAAQRDAVREYRRRARAGRVPEPLPDAERVAEFVGGNYATHRF
ncbi:glycosyltransferase family 2 protein [soil metagenome]